MNDLYLIESLEHRWDDNVTWWGPNRTGYVQSLAEAGRYTKKEAEEICKKANYGGKINERYYREADVMSGQISKFRVMTVAIYR